MLRSSFRLIFILFFSVLVVFVGCDEDGGVGPIQEEDEGPKLSDDAYVIEETDSFSYSEKEDSTYTFNYTGVVPEITVGKIIAGKIIKNDTLKGGYLRRVSSIDTLDEVLKIETEFASLSEAVEHGEIDTTFQLTISQNNMLRSGRHELATMQMVHAAEGVSVTDYGIDLSGVTLYSGSAEGFDLDVTITDGEISFEPLFSFGGKIEWFKLTEFHTTAGGELSFDCNIQATSTGELEYSKEKTIASFRHYAYQQIGPLPVVEKITLSFIAGFDLNSNGEIDVQSGFESSYGLELGARYNQDWSPSWQEVWEPNGNFVVLPIIWNQSTGVTLQGYVKARIDVELYTVTGPYMEGKPYLEFDANIQTVPESSWNWDLYAGVIGALGFQVSILDYELADFNKPLVDWRRTIASGSNENAPTVSIISPDDGSTFSSGDMIIFEGEAEDPQDGILSGSDLVWTSDKDGQIGTGSSLDASGLSVNQHIITLTASDSHGNTGSDIITITVYSSSNDDFTLIPAGTFTMGSPTDEPGRYNNESQHQVTLTKGFYMSKYEVTEEWWYEVMGGTPTTSQYPKIYVSWQEAIEFCNELSIIEGYTPVYTINGPEGDVTWNQIANGYRLPTEAEWEYACRATTTMAFNNNTNCLSSDTEANYDGNYPLDDCSTGLFRDGRTTVGTFPPNDWGLFDMHGNVWEWVWDGYRSDYENLPAEDPVYNDVGPEATRLGRGGSWNYYARACRSAYRQTPYQGFQGDKYCGFRICRSVFSQ